MTIYRYFFPYSLDYFCFATETKITQCRWMTAVYIFLETSSRFESRLTAPFYNKINIQIIGSRQIITLYVTY